MKTLCNLERILTTIRHREPDTVPTFENLIDSRVRDKIRAGLSYEDFVEYMDLDAIVQHEIETDTVEVLSESGELIRDQWGAIRSYTPGSDVVTVLTEAPIKSENDLKKYIPPDPDTSKMYERLEQKVKRFKGKRAVIALFKNPSEIVRDHMLGQVEYWKAIKTNPDFVLRLTQISQDYYLKFVKNCISVGIDILWVGGDIANTMGPFLSPADTARFVLPSERKIIEYAKSKGVPCLRHTDGNIWPIFDLLIDVGYDAIHPLDPLGGMALDKVKIKYGDKICLMGNVDCTHLLTWGTPDEVHKAVKKCIQQAGRGGGYICTSSNSIHGAVKPENYVAMVQAIREYGKYPMSF